MNSGGGPGFRPLLPEQGEAHPVSTWAQFRLLIRKNLTIKRRNPRLILLEVVLPVVLVSSQVLSQTGTTEHTPVQFMYPDSLYDASLGAFWMTNARPLESIAQTAARTGRLLYSSRRPRSRDSPSLQPEAKELCERVTARIVAAAHNQSAVHNQSCAEAVVDDLDTAYAARTDEVWAGVLLDRADPAGIGFTLRFPNDYGDFSNSATELMALDAQIPTADQGQDWVQSGFLALQHAVSCELAAMVEPGRSLPASCSDRPPRVSQFPTPESEVDHRLAQVFCYSNCDHNRPTAQATGTGPALSLVEGMGFALAMFARQVASDKEEKRKELLGIMGCKPWVFYMAYIVLYVVQVGIYALAVGLMTRSWFEYSGYGVLVGLTWLWGVLGIVFTTATLSLFQTATMATTAVIFAYILPFLVFIALDKLTAAIGQALATCGTSSALWSSLGGASTCGTPAGQLMMGCTLEGSLAWLHLISRSIHSWLGMQTRSESSHPILIGWQVMPQEYGTQLSPGFLFTREYWCARDGSENFEVDSPELIELSGLLNDIEPDETIEEPLPQEALTMPALKVSHLRKEFRVAGQHEPVIAVHNLCLTMLESQITALLGHNGAGKTTAISMLTGLIQPTCGGATYKGLSTLRMDEFRESIGFCPQHDILHKDLTVRETLQLYAGVKGTPLEACSFEAAHWIELLQLGEFSEQRVKKLSGGWKRRVCLGMALIAGSELVFLDEPTSGMDPEARHHTWDILQGHKHGKVLILTTHFMDEADVLGDRIAIMVGGKLKVCGTSLFLKDQFGLGYTLTTTVLDQDGSQSVMETIEAKISGSKKLSSAGTELSYQLPREESAKFPELLRALDEMKSTCIEDYGLSSTTLEEVFLKVAEGQMIGDTDATTINSETDHDKSESEATDLKRFCEVRVSDISPYVQFKALFRKRMAYAKRELSELFRTYFMPVLYVVLGFVLYHTVTFAPSVHSRQISLGMFGQLQMPVNGDQQDVGLCQNSMIHCSDAANASVAAFSCEKDPVGYGFLKTGVVSAAEVAANCHSANTSIGLQAPVYALANSLAQNFNGGVPFYTAAVSGDPSLYLYNSTAVNMVPAIVNAADEAALNQSIVLNNYPFPLASDALIRYAAIRSILLVTIVAVAFGMAAAKSVTFPIKERTTGVKHQIMACGISPTVYWGHILLFDFMMYLTLAGLFVVCLYIFGVDSITSNHTAFLAVVLILLIGGLSYIELILLFSYVMDDAATADGTARLICSLGSAALQAPFFAVSNGGYGSTLKILETVFYVVFGPVFGLPHGIGNVMTEAAIYQNSSMSIFRWDCAGAAIILLSANAVILWVLLIVCERCALTGKGCCGEPVVDTDLSDGFTVEEVIEHEAEIKSGQGTYRIKLEDVCKAYHGDRKKRCKREPPKVAVKNLTLGVMPGECFGLLGVNGAGKTSILKCLAGEQAATSGSLLVDGLDTTTDRELVNKSLGYCPQFDSLLSLLTAREHLELFATLKGVAQSDIPEVVQAVIRRIGLEEFADRRCGGYSGGNKRKLSTALALLAGPGVVLLDEPSTGMDPVARRFLWKLISACRSITARGNGLRSVVLTTHAMEEAEALSSRMCIMVAGRIRALGTVQQLKTKFGSSYSLELRVREGRIASVSEFIDALGWGAQQIDLNLLIIRYSIPSEGNSLPQMFETLEKNKAKQGIEQYALCQTTLEQVFIQLAKEQEMEESINQSTLIEMDE